MLTLHYMKKMLPQFRSDSLVNITLIITYLGNQFSNSQKNMFLQVNKDYHTAFDSNLGAYNDRSGTISANRVHGECCLTPPPPPLTKENCHATIKQT